MRTGTIVGILLFPVLLSAQKQPVTVKAIGLGVVPGTIACQNLAAVSVMFHLYSDAWEERMQAVVTRGASRMINGDPAPAPNLARYGCAMAKSGMSMRLESESPQLGFGLVSFKLPSGKIFRGVTQANMYAHVEKP